MKVKSTLLLTGLLVLSMATFAQINFEHSSWKQVKAKAAELNKPIFVDAYTTWCGPCKWMSANLFPDEAVGAHFNENFVSFKLDMEKGEGVDFAKKYGVRAYPTMLYFDAEGEMIHRVVGAPRTGETLISQAQDALNPDKQYAALKERWEEGDRTPKFMYNYAYTLQTAYEPTDEVAEEYLATIPKDQWGNPDNWQFITDMVRNYQSETFLYIVGNKDMMSQEIGPEAIKSYASDVLGQAIYMVARTKSEDELKRVKNQFEELLGEDAPMYMAKADYVFYQRDSEKRHEYALAYFDGFEPSSQELNSIAWTYYKSEEDTERLEKALDWAQRSVEMEATFHNTDTEAHLLMKLKRYEECLAAAAKSVELGKAAKEDVSTTQALLEKAQKLVEAPDGADGSK